MRGLAARRCLATKGTQTMRNHRLPSRPHLQGVGWAPRGKLRTSPPRSLSLRTMAGPRKPPPPVTGGLHESRLVGPGCQLLAKDLRVVADVHREVVVEQEGVDAPRELWKSSLWAAVARNSAGTAWTREVAESHFENRVAHAPHPAASRRRCRSAPTAPRCPGRRASSP